VIEHAILDIHRRVVIIDPSDVDQLITYGQFMDDEGRRRVARTLMPSGKDISTLFLGINVPLCSFGNREPEWFETMIFLPDGCTVTYGRYATYDEAWAGHRECVGRLLVTMGISPHPPIDKWDLEIARMNHQLEAQS
jgi:hypothetical protein